MGDKISLKNNYLNHISQNKYFLTKNYGKLRIATYNIHYWTDVWENNKMNEIIKDIKYINADIIFLQEVIFGVKYKVKNNYIDTRNIITILEKLDYFVVFCNTLPTWYNGIYGNMMCIKNKFKNKINVSNHTFEKYTENNKINKKLSNDETRCFIKLEYLDFVIIGVHLCVNLEKNRLKQIKYISKILNKEKYKNKKLILLGDFNTTNVLEYENKIIKNNILKYVFNNNRYFMKNNCIKILNDNKFLSVTNKIKLTVWSNIQCDYIFTKNINKYKSHVLYTNNSDHLPIICDIY